MHDAFRFGMTAAAWLFGLLRRAEILALLPVVSLVAYWMGGERALILATLGLPVLMLFAAAIRPGSEGVATVHPLLSDPLRHHLITQLDRHLAEAPQTGRQTACLVLQFDGAERILQRHGRAAQAEVIARSTERICGALRMGDLVARLEGGGLAVAVQPVRRLDLETLVQMAARLQRAVAEPVLIDSARVYVTCSVGFCLSQRAPESGGAGLLDAAQAAADEALRYGPGAIRAFAPDMARARQQRHSLREELELALDEGQIRPHFQPQLSTESGDLTGVEALARWHHPTRGLLSPSEFLPLIEETGLSERLGEVMLFHSLSALARWRKAGLNVPMVAVNFSAAELGNPRLVDKLKWELDRFDLPPQRLGVEVLETVVSQTENDMIATNIAALARLGCGIDLDDFGTGHASITTIRRFAVRRLKIDRSFVTRVDTDRDQQQMVAAILSLAERLGLETLAEGVETQGEYSTLAQLGCGHVQGFGIARPMPLDQATDWIGRHQDRERSLPRIGQRGT